MRANLSPPSGLNSDDTVYGARGRWRAGNNVRFYKGRAQTDGGFESFVDSLLSGVCRAALPWSDNTGVLNVAFGTHTNLYTWLGGALADITPYGPATLLGANPLTTHTGTARVDVHQVAHGFTTGIQVEIDNAVAVGGITPNGTFTITVDGVDDYHFTFGSNATSSVTGGGTQIVATPQTLLPAGAADGTGSAGFGTGGYGDGPWGETPATADYFPRTWSLQPWGQQLLASPRGGALYVWTNNLAQRAAIIPQAPTQITQVLVAPMNGGYQCFALGTQEEVSGAFNSACIRHSSVRDYTTWRQSIDGSTAREYILTGGGQIVGGRMVGPYMLVWTQDSLFLGTYVGSLDEIWRFDRIGKNCGLIGPNAAVVVGQTAYWASPDRQFWMCQIGGEPQIVPCPIRDDYSDNLAASQGDKIMASTTAEFGEVRWDYPDARDGFENSRFVRLCASGQDAGAWSQGQVARTAYVDAGPSLNPIGVTPDGHCYYHERGNSADGAALSGFLRTAGQIIDTDWRVQVKRLWPDFQDQVGPITVRAYAYEHPQGDPTFVDSNPISPGDAAADIWISGRMIVFEFMFNSAPARWRIGDPVIEYEMAGRAQ